MINPFKKKKLLIIDDDPAMLELVGLIFSHTEAQVYPATNGPEGLQLFYQHQPDLVILDLMMPQMSGWEVCRAIRQLSNVPIIMLTALGQDINIIRGLNYGADDYVVKPFNAEVLKARAQAALRKTAYGNGLPTYTTYSDGYLTIDIDARQVCVNDEPVKLTTKEYRLLSILFQNSDQVLTFEQILEKVWGWEYRDSIHYVHTYMSHLRRKLEPDPKNPRYLQTEHGTGYRFERQAPLP